MDPFSHQIQAKHIQNLRIREGKQVERKGDEAHVAAIDVVFVLEDAVEDGGIGEDDESEAPGAASGLIPHDGGVEDLPIVPEVFPELLLGGLPRNPADEQLPLVRIHPTLRDNGGDAERKRRGE